jgi:hypothetical protein
MIVIEMTIQEKAIELLPDRFLLSYFCIELLRFNVHAT